MTRRLCRILLLIASLLPALVVPPARAAPHAGGRIVGAVTDVVTGAPLPDIHLTLYDCWRSYHVECWDVAETSTDPAGQYVFDDPPDAWGLYVFDPTDVYLHQDVADFRQPGPDETVMLNVALQRYDRVYGSIGGRVTIQATGAPASGLEVFAYGLDTTGIGRLDHTDADGVYRLDELPAGRYWVRFGWIGAAGPYAGQYYGGVYAAEIATPVVVVAGAITTDIDGALEENGRIGGTVRSAVTGAPLAGAWVRICVYYENNCFNAVTGTGGTYLSEPLAPRNYTVQAGAAGYRARFYRNATQMEDATVTPIAVATVTDGIDISLPDMGHIIGRVTNATGQPIAGITVRRVGTITPTAWTDRDGRYDFNGLENGVYTLRFVDPQGRYAGLTSERIKVTVGAPATYDVALAWDGARLPAEWLPWVGR